MAALKRIAYGVFFLNVIFMPVAAMADPAADILINMFEWWNSAFREKGAFTEEAFARHFTPDAVMVINGKERARGVADLAAHFQRIQANVDEVEIVLPFIEGFSNGDKTFTYHKVRAVHEGQESVEDVMGWAEIRDGRLAYINFLSVAAHRENEAVN